MRNTSLMRPITSNNPKISIIIPFYVDTKRFFVDLKKFNKLNYKNYEIIIVSDKKIKVKNPKTRVLITGKETTGPAEKRDIAIKSAKGEICAFIDDDAYPDKNWLKNAVVHFKHPQIVAVGGPGITPKEDNYYEQLTGLVYSSYFCGGQAQHRFVKKHAMFVDDYPAYNLIIRKDVLKKVGGYGTHFYGGEDTFLCLKLIKGGHRIIYDPEVVVHHHRRALFLPYLRQISNIGTHRGYFAKKFPETSRRFDYFIPSILALGFLTGAILSIYNLTIFYLYTFSIIFFVLLGMISVIKSANIKDAFIVSLGIIATHLTYGVFFVNGLMTQKLKR